MKILNLEAVNDLRLEEREKPIPKEGEVLVEIHACGICSSDEARVLKTGTYHFPTVPGHEFSGKVVELGKNVSNDYLNKKVAVFPLLPCFSCSACKEKHYPMCKNYKYFGSRNDGGYAEYLSVPVWNLVVLDDSIDYKVGALMEPSAVALHATNIGNIKKGDNVAIVGTGTIGILIGVLSKIKGANVGISGRKEKSLETSKELGFNTLGIENQIEEALELTNGEGMDIVFEAVGTNAAMEKSILMTKNAGTIVAVGNPHGDFNLEKDVYWKILRRQLTLKGTWNSEYNDEVNDWKEVAKLMKEGNFPFEELITKTFKLEEHKEAFELLTNKDISKAKLMFVINEDKEA